MRKTVIFKLDAVHENSTGYAQAIQIVLGIYMKGNSAYKKDFILS